jgi:hypothetical protein
VPPRLAALVRARALDAELAALLEVLLGARTPVIVAGQAGSGREAVADALADCLPTSATLLPVRPDDEFGWLPEARSMGWRPEPPGSPGTAPDLPPADPRSGVLAVRDLADPGAGGPDGDRSRLVVRALSLGYGLVATMPGGSLEEVLERLHGPAVGTDEDERSRLGVVLVMAPADRARGARVAVAHYLRPVALDTHGHVQRLPPAVLATWNQSTDRWDHFAWGALPDLAGRVGLAPRELELEQARRATALEGRAQ